MHKNNLENNFNLQFTTINKITQVVQPADIPIMHVLQCKEDFNNPLANLSFSECTATVSALSDLLVQISTLNNQQYHEHWHDSALQSMFDRTCCTPVISLCFATLTTVQQNM